MPYSQPCPNPSHWIKFAIVQNEPIFFVRVNICLPSYVCNSFVVFVSVKCYPISSKYTQKKFFLLHFFFWVALWVCDKTCIKKRRDKTCMKKKSVCVWFTVWLRIQPSYKKWMYKESMSATKVGWWFQVFVPFQPNVRLFGFDFWQIFFFWWAVSCLQKRKYTQKHVCVCVCLWDYRRIAMKESK